LIVALNGPDKLIGEGQVLRLPNVVPANRDYGGAVDEAVAIARMFNVDGNQPKATMWWSTRAKPAQGLIAAAISRIGSGERG
jgi:hypothetical protein